MGVATMELFTSAALDQGWLGGSRIGMERDISWADHDGISSGTSWTLHGGQAFSDWQTPISDWTPVQRGPGAKSRLLKTQKKRGFVRQQLLSNAFGGWHKVDSPAGW